MKKKNWLRKLFCIHYFGHFDNGQVYYYLYPKAFVWDMSGLHIAERDLVNSSECLGCGYRFFDTSREGLIL